MVAIAYSNIKTSTNNDVSLAGYFDVRMTSSAESGAQRFSFFDGTYGGGYYTFKGKVMDAAKEFFVYENELQYLKFHGTNNASQETQWVKGAIQLPSGSWSETAWKSFTADSVADAGRTWSQRVGQWFDGGTGTGWAGYDLYFDGNDIDLTVKVDLWGVTAPQAAVWEKKIESLWNGFGYRDSNGETYEVNVDVQFITDYWKKVALGENQNVTVHNKSGRMDAYNLYLQDPWGRPDETVVAHEFGHWIGVADEYRQDSKGNFLYYLTTGTLMSDLSEVIKPEYFTGIQWWVEKNMGVVLVAVDIEPSLGSSTYSIGI